MSYHSSQLLQTPRWHIEELLITFSISYKGRRVISEKFLNIKDQFSFEELVVIAFVPLSHRVYPIQLSAIRDIINRISATAKQ